MARDFKSILLVCILSLLPWVMLSQLRAAVAVPAFRPPAVPLVTFDPYMSIWSETNNLTDDTTRYWDGNAQSLVSLIQIDGTTYRLMGNDPSTVPADERPEQLPPRAVAITSPTATETICQRIKCS